MMERITCNSSMYRERGTGSAANHCLSRAADLQPIPAGSSFGSYYNHLGLIVKYGLHDAGIGNAELQTRLRMDPRFSCQSSQTA